ncbi:MAG: hypothetical protein J6T01_03465 [Kiritimatiellae bacterium]|nr:hypothetical protein [Kiritimatiellia bacterium]
MLTRIGGGAIERQHDCLYASNANLPFDKTAMSVPAWTAVLRVFAKKGAHMIQPNCNSVEELIDAQTLAERSDCPPPSALKRKSFPATFSA